VTEPATALTDFALAALAVFFSTKLAHARWWRRSFALCATSALLGGVYHGFHEALPPLTVEALWWMTLVAASLTCFATMRAVIDQWLERPGPWIRAARLKLITFLALGVLLPVFEVVIADASLTMVFATVAAILGRRRDPRASRLLLAGVALFVTGALVQQGGGDPRPWFNHNDLFHAIQLVANTFFFLSARSRPTARV
jgi:hypothetical protein